MNLLFEDQDIIVCHKSAGIATQTGKIGEKDMVSELKNYLSDGNLSTGTGKEPYVGLVHRLDQGVEGVLVFAKTPSAAADLSKQVTEHTMKKFYYAVVSGTVKQQEATLVDYLIKDGKTNTSRVVNKGMTGAKRAELTYRCLNQNDVSLLEIELITGRHHQIRVQLSNQGLPLVNDYKYGYHDTSRQDKTVTKSEGIALCAYKLSFLHPKKHKPMTFTVTPSNPVFEELLA